MKLFSMKSFLVSGALTFAACCCGGSNMKPNNARAEDTRTEASSVVRDYLVKGMTCGGCVFGVKKALNRAGVSQDQIEEVAYDKPDPEHKIGHAKVKFSKDQYKGQDTDCKIVKEIKESPGYIAYWDSSNTDPCGLQKKN